MKMAENFRSEKYQPACPWHIRLGDLFISPGTQQDKVWIGEVKGGEGGNFDPDKLAPLIQQFYQENF
jgi:hypothetical protein